MSRSREYTRNQRAKAVCRKRRTSLSLLGGDLYAHNGCYSKNQVRLWRCARDRMERIPDMREMIAIIKMDEQIFEFESNIKKENKK